MRNRIIGIAIVVVAIAAAVGFKFYLDSRSGGSPGGLAGVVAPKQVVTLTGYVGGEKVGLLDDPEVQKILAEKYGIKLAATKAGSFEMMDLADSKTDFLFPGSQTAVEYLRSKETLKPLKIETVLSSPIVIYSWADIAGALQKAGIVRKVNDTYYVVDMPKLVKAMEEGKSWASLGVPNIYGKTKVVSTDPNKSNSGNQFAGLLANVMTGDVATPATISAVLPRLKALFGRLGFMSSSSGDLFNEYLRLGEGADPMVAGYENQVVEFADANQSQWAGAKDRIAILYPQPTVWSQHQLVALTDKAVPLIAAMQDPAIQKIAWERHGFRAGAAGAANNAPKGINGIPATVDKVVVMPEYAVMRAIMDALRQ
jgi:hypothetical protein